MVAPIILRFATVYIENLYSDIIKDKDPYETIETFISKPGSGIQIVSRDNKQFLELYPHGEKISIEISRELVEDTLYSFEVARDDYDVIEEISLERFKTLGKYENKEADWAIQKLVKRGQGDFHSTSSPVGGYQFIKFKNREMVKQIDAYFKQ